MFKRVTAFIARRKQAKEQIANGKKMEVYYDKIRNGALFLQYIHTDMSKQKESMNRAQRRRMDRELKQKGKFSTEVISRYMAQVAQVNEYIAEEMMKVKRTQVGNLVKRGVAKELAKLKKAEKK